MSVADLDPGDDKITVSSDMILSVYRTDIRTTHDTRDRIRIIFTIKIYPEYDFCKPATSVHALSYLIREIRPATKQDTRQASSQ